MRNAPWLAKEAIANSSDISMSSYFKSLDWQGKERYREKLESVGLTLKDDSYSPENDGFRSDMTNWPKIEYGHIFAYFIVRPGTYTQEELLSWKQLEAYNYFECGYVRTVLSMVFGHGKGRCVVRMFSPTRQL